MLSTGLIPYLRLLAFALQSNFLVVDLEAPRSRMCIYESVAHALIEAHTCSRYTIKRPALLDSKSEYFRLVQQC